MSDEKSRDSKAPQENGHGNGHGEGHPEISMEPDVHFYTDTPPHEKSKPDPDPLTSWRQREAGKPVTLEQIHSGLIAAVEYTKAAIEGNLGMTVDLSDAVVVRAEQISGLSAKVENLSAFVHKIDEESAKRDKVIDGVRRDVQFMKDDVREIKTDAREAASQLPAIKDLLSEILARLPELKIA
jgi:hypothetical protein